MQEPERECSRYVKLLDIWASDFVPRPRSLSGLGGAEAEVEQEPKAYKEKQISKINQNQTSWDTSMILHS